ncbi:MAG: AbrB/MazE/SpoVT family DNA-binding domain-containing protein [Candidatus Hermodarchaeota archaeon]
MSKEKIPKPPEQSEPFEHPRPPRHMRKKVRIIVKGYMRPDGSSYHVVIPKKIREMMKLEGGEYFLMAARPMRDEIRLKKVEFFEEE